MSHVATGGRPRLEFAALRSSRRLGGLAEDVAAGFSTRPRWLPPKYFYDARGSRLFDRICATPEYYPCRVEAALLARWAPAIMAQAAPEQVFELGSGSCRKTRHLLSACPPLGLAPRFWPLDVCREMLLATSEQLLEEYPWLSLTALWGDYGGGLQWLPRPPGRRLFVFLGGTMGNFPEPEARRFLTELRGLMRAGDHLLLGLDRVKAPERLEAAYNDAAGVTARFNLNLLTVINRELAADFDLERFGHRAVYNAAAQRIEMYLVAHAGQRVRIAALDRSYTFAPGEALLTEISRKFTPASLTALLEEAGLAPAAHYQQDGDYSLVLARPR